MMKTTGIKVFFFFLVLAFLGITFWLKRLPSATSQEKFMLDTLVKVKFYSHSSEPTRLLTNSFELMERLGDMLNYFDPQSELSQLNSTRKTTVSKELYELLQTSKNIGRRTEGLLDITIGPLMDLWDFEHGGTLPNPLSIKKALAHVGLEKLHLKRGRGVELEPESRVDLGGVSKGYILDKAVEYLQSQGVKAGFISMRSVTKVWGKKPGNVPWKIGLEHPRQPGKIIAKITLKSGEAVSTSGDYQRYFIENNRRYHHLINPKTGYPPTQLRSLTVITKDSATLADALSTAFFIAGPAKSKLWAEEWQVGVILIDQQNKVEVINLPAGKVEIIEEN
jgi:thiamine biosynthesis lipoprotein